MSAKPEGPAALMKRVARAKDARRSWDGLLRDAFRYAAPDVDTGFQGIGAGGQNRRVQVYDATAIQAVEDAAAATHQTLSPPTEVFCSLDLTPAAARDVEAQGGSAGLDAIRRLLDQTTERVFEHLAASNFHSVAGVAYLQSVISTGVLTMNEAPAGSPSAFSFEAPPLFELYLEPGPGQECRTVFRERTMKAEMLLAQWPSADLPPALRRKVDKEPACDVTIVDGAVYDWQDGRFRYVVLWQGAGKSAEEGVHLLLEQRQNTSPFLVFREQISPGEMLGRGRVLSVLPDIKTCNKAVELVLKNASIAVTGIWQADDDGVLNPSAVRLVPGAIIPKAVGSSGLQPLQAPGRFDVADLVIGELRQRIRTTIVGPELPGMEKRRDVTATEMDYRWSEVQLLRAPRLLRLWPTIVEMMRRAIDILSRRGEVQPIPDVGSRTAVNPVSRMLQMAHLADVMRAQTGLQLVAGMFPQAVGRKVDQDRAVEWSLRKSGVPADWILSDDQAQAAAADDAQRQALAETAGMANQAAPMVKALSDAYRTDVETAPAGQALTEDF